MTERPVPTSKPPGTRPQRSSGTRIELRDHPQREAILWTPWKLWVTQTSVGHPWDIVLTQPALAAILDQVFRAGDEGVAGVLGGRLFRCPSSKRQWVRVDSVWGSPQALPDACEDAALAQALAPAPFGDADNGLVRVGWYHSHSRLNATPTEAESRFHESQFSKPWHFAMILLARSDPAGGVFQRSGARSLRGSQSLPFYELPSATRADGSRQTLVHWQNHTTDNRVHLIDPDSLRALTPPISAPASLGGPSMRPQRARSTSPGELTEAARPGTLRRGLAGAIAAIALLASGWFLWARFGPENANVGGSSQFASPVSSPTALSLRLVDFDRAASTFLGVEARSGVGCEELIPAFQGVESAFLSVARAYTGLGEGDSDSGAADYKAAGLRMDEIVHRFDAAGCVRP